LRRHSRIHWRGGVVVEINRSRFVHRQFIGVEYFLGELSVLIGGMRGGEFFACIKRGDRSILLFGMERGNEKLAFWFYWVANDKCLGEEIGLITSADAFAIGAPRLDFCLEFSKFLAPTVRSVPMGRER
jgi:hypothetical protein